MGHDQLVEMIFMASKRASKRRVERSDPPSTEKANPIENEKERSREAALE